jgi:O-antigen/teichoic acid export membrane protein
MRRAGAVVRAWQERMAAWTGRSRFARNVWDVARANLLAQALPVLAAPLLTRLYAPEHFGVLALFAAVMGMALAIGTARFDWSIPNARSPAMAAALLALGALVLVACALALGLAWVLGSTRLPSPWQALGMVGWLLPLAVLGGGAQQLLQAWHVRGGELSDVGRAKVTQSAANVLTSIVAAGLGAWGLVLGVLAGSWVGLGTLWRRAAGLQGALRRLSRHRLAVAWRRFRGEAAWSTLASALNAASFAVVPLMLARHHATAEVGYYALMQRVALGPVGLIGAAVSQSFWAEAARLVRDDVPALSRLYRRSTARLAWVALPLALLALAGPLYVGPIFGDAQWAQAGWVLAATVPMLVGQVVASPLSHLIIHRRQHWQALWDLVRVLLLVATIESMGRAGLGFAPTVLGLSAVMAGMYAVLMLLNLRAIALASK